MSVHIGAKPGDIAETVLMPGDPLRAKYIAETYLENIVCYNEVRGMLGFTGTYQGKRVSVQGSGMGLPSMSIYANELITEYGVKNLIRVGTCGGMQEHVRVRDVVLAQAACTDSSMNRHVFGGYDFAPVASFPLLLAAYERGTAKGMKLHVGNVFSSDSFYRDDKSVVQKLMAHGVLGVEMETTALYTLAAKHGVNALTILTVSDHLITGEETTAAERQSTFNDMMIVALDTAVSL
ncbi:purine-nucleoside phosphorylase [Paenibacillus mucilaginosus]|nr:purine-nucleoside phosphorylase [Paenibacillus mucilaginosus]AEI43830.1 DeoD [Paenibacillus mucilaginosus KNP414]AFH63776.1 purine nucleoside phosphorylase [Paenibacillus mucilaginosus K02]MCG7212655.1 purine-nucleoside phosphorylase [Paenibacillus mucilaginosus]WDM25326.1 purine-nucleoside phosphorylase [Paenibacillus mucilaginosus]WFA19986.1 purine-nucleoside phosphorylase [Paenibacillus mucilaginosus]